MAIFPFFKKKKLQPIIGRCTYCYYELTYSLREVRLLERQNALDPVCPVKEPCHICHIGFIIPVKYTGILGKLYLFHEIKPKIKNLDPDTVMERIFNVANHQNIFFFSPDDLNNDSPD